MSAITLTELNYDETTPGDGAEVAAYLRTGTEALTSTSGSLNVNVTNTVTVSATDLDIRDLDAAQDNIAISDGTDTLAINNDGSINAVVSATDLDIRDLSSATDSVLAVTQFQYAEDSAHSSGAVGAFVMAVRNDAGTALAADGDYIPFTTDATGALRVAGSLSVTEADVFAEDSAFTEGDMGTHNLTVRYDAYTTTTSASGDYQSLKSDVFGRLWTNDSANSAIANGAATVTTSSALLVAANSGRRRILVQNLGSKKVYLGASGVSTSSGIMLAQSGSVELDLGPALALHAVAESGSQDVRYLQLA